MTAIIAVSFFLLSLILGSLVAGERAPAEDDFIDLSVPATQQLPQKRLTARKLNSNEQFSSKRFAEVVELVDTPS